MNEVLIPLVVAAGGALGALGRVAVYRLLDRAWAPAISRSTGALPSLEATLLVNGLGSFLLGLVHGHFGGAADPIWIRAFVATGICGALTTFSTVCADAVALIDARERGRLALYIGAQGLVCVLAVAVGRFCTM